MIDFADDLENCKITLKATGRLTQINNEGRLVKVLQAVQVMSIKMADKGSRNQK